MDALFTKRFNEVLTYSKISQTELAARVNVSKQCISDYKSGKSFPSIQKLFLISKVLEVSADYLLGLTDEYK